MYAQLSRLSYAPDGTVSPATIRLADRIAALAPDPESRVFFVSGGSEAVETAVKMARADIPVGDGLVRPCYSFCTFGYALSAAGLAKLLDVGFERDLIPVDELLPALYMPHPRADVRDRYPARLSAYAFEPPLVTQLPKEVAGSDTEATAFVTPSATARRLQA